MTAPDFVTRGDGLTVREIAALTNAQPRPGVDLERRSGRALIFEHGLGKRLVQLFQGALGVSLVKQVHCAIIAQTPRDDRVRADLFGGARE